MSTGTPVRPSCWNTALRPSEADAVLADDAAERFVAAMREPFAHRPDRRKVVNVEKWAWWKWLDQGLHLAASRIARMILDGSRRDGVAWTVRCLAPLAELGGCDVVPRAQTDAIGSVDEEISEAAVAGGRVYDAAKHRLPRHEMRVLVESAKAELDDVLEAGVR